MHKMRRAIVLGVNGQDGSYLAEHLLADGWEVHGVGRQKTAKYLQLEHSFQYHEIDMSRPNSLSPLFEEVSPDRIYYLAAVHGAAGFSYEDKWQDVVQVNLAGVHQCLEYMRNIRNECRLLYASSLKVFGDTPPRRITENCPRVSSCLYSISKNAAHDLINYYRDKHDLRATVLFLLNHDSPRRPSNFFLPKVVGILAAAIKCDSKPLRKVYTLDFACDWGSSEEFMRIAHLALEHAENSDYVLGSGRTWTGLELVEALFQSAGLNWQKYISPEVKPGVGRVQYYEIDLSRLRQQVGVVPELGALDVAHWILKEAHGLVCDEGGDVK